MSTTYNQSQFLLLLHQPQTGPGPTPQELRQIMDRFTVWMDAIKAQGKLVGSNGLESGGKTLRGPGGASVTDGPFSETKEIVGGYILITADDLDQAVQIARGCPGLDYRLAVEVRPVKQRQ